MIFWGGMGGGVGGFSLIIIGSGVGGKSGT
jgi:hypothetical protein